MEALNVAERDREIWFMKNIYIEGIQGMGKSTLVNRISNAIPELHVCREGDYSPTVSYTHLTLPTNSRV